MQDIKSLHHTVEGFINTHNTFWVKLSLFLAKFISILKTDAADKVEHIKEIKFNLEKLEKEYEQNIAEHKEIIKSNEGIDRRINQSVLSRLAKPTDQQAIHTAAPAPSFLDTYNRIRNNFAAIQPPQKIHEEPMPAIVLTNTR